jgi:nucleoside-diphosphate kinase
MIKPDGVQRGLVGAIIRRLEKRGLKLVAAQMLNLSEDLAESFYAEHHGKDFFRRLVAYVTSGPVVAMVWEAEGAVAAARATIGATDPTQADPGTIRRDFGVDISQNLIHGADSEASAVREIKLFFEPEDILAYTRMDEDWLRET